MRSFVLWLVFSLGFAGIMGAQSLTEFGAAAAGGAAGGAAGKKVSDGITTIFGKVDKQMAEAAKPAKPSAAKPAAKPEATPEAAPPLAGAPPVSAGNVPAPPKPRGKTLRKGASSNVAKSADKSADKVDKNDAYSLVPPPPPIPRAAIVKPVETPSRLVAQAPPAAAAPVQLIPVPPPPPPPVTVEDLERISPGTDREEVLKLGPFASCVTMIEDGHLTETFRYAAGVVRVSDGLVAAVELR